MKRLFFIVSLAVGLLTAATVQAHFVWVIQQGDQIRVNFCELADAPEPDLLSKVSAAKVWAIVPGERGGSTTSDVPITLESDKLSGAIPEDSAAVIVAHEYGVVSKGGGTFLLRYLAKQHLSPLPGKWTAVEDKERLPLEVTPAWIGGKLQLTVSWQGEAAPGIEVKASGAGIEETLTTDDKGQVICEPKSDGVLSIRAKQSEDTSGELNGEKYDSIRTYSTLTLPVTLPTIAPVAHHVPELTRGITSFGAAIAGTDLYVYGGHFGQAHHYSDGGQSNEFRRVSLTAEKPEWQLLPEGPKLTGLALVEFNGKLYRVGGFTAKNKDDEDQSLWSQDSFACFDPATNSWTDLPPLPEGRSSHDAAVVDGKLYVVGGWKLAGEEETAWHKTAWSCDLTETDLQWTALPEPPFQRRALSLAGMNGKLYVIGGMQPTDGVTTDVAVFDPATSTWSEAPAINGSGMEGFGTSSFTSNDKLIVTTMSGSIQSLTPGADAWTVAGQVDSPRFFHRQLTTADGDILIIGGASMQTGKTNSAELFTFTK